MPALPDIQSIRVGRLQSGSSPYMLGQLIVSLGLVTWLGALLAVAIAALAWGGAVAAEAKIQMVYDDAGMAVINISGKPLDVSSLSFRRLAETGEVSASFAATQWELSGLGPAKALPGGACYQLLSQGPVLLQLSPGEAPVKPASCRVSQGWLLALKPSWQFWTAGSGGGTFQVLYSEKVIHTCQIAAGSCQFTLPEP